jgi:hypothetical protein
MLAITVETLTPVKDIIDNWFLEVHATDPHFKTISANRDTIKGIFEQVGYQVEYVRHDGLFCFKPEQYAQD